MDIGGFLSTTCSEDLKFDFDSLPSNTRRTPATPATPASITASSACFLTMAQSLSDANLLEGDASLTEEEREKAKLDLEADEEDAMELGGEVVSPVIKTSQNGTFRFGLVFVTLYPLKEIHYGRLVPVHPKIFRTFSNLFPEFSAGPSMFAHTIDPNARFSPSFPATQDYWDFLEFLQNDPPFLSRCPHIRVHLDSRRAVTEPTNVFFPLLLDSARKRNRDTTKVEGTPSSTASAPAKKGGHSSSAPASASASASNGKKSSAPTPAAASASKTSAKGQMLPPKQSVKPSKSSSVKPKQKPSASLPPQTAAGLGNRRSVAAAASVTDPASQRVRLEIWESRYDQNPVPTPLYTLMEGAFRIELKSMVRAKKACLRIASEMDWMQRDSSKECGVITSRSPAQSKLIKDAIEALKVTWNGVVYNFQVLEANRVDRHKAYVRLFTLHAQDNPREYIRGVMTDVMTLDPFIGAEDFRPGHPTKMEDYVRMTIFVSDRLRKFILDAHHTIPAIGGALRVDFQDEIQARRAAQATAAAAKAAANPPPPATPTRSAAAAKAAGLSKEGATGTGAAASADSMDGIKPIPDPPQGDNAKGSQTPPPPPASGGREPPAKN